MNEHKIPAFEYMVIKLMEWFNEENPGKPNDLTLLKTMKLCFFVTAANSDSHFSFSLIDNVFNRFVAMPYGHVESDLYKHLKKGEIKNVKIYTNSPAEKIEEPTLDPATRTAIDQAVSFLRTKDKSFINHSANDLVVLSHRFFSWKFFFQKARLRGVYSIDIPGSVIKSEAKFYYL